MYNGYRLKIEGVKVSNSDIAKGSYESSREPRIIEEYMDGYGYTHTRDIDLYKTYISFALREHSSDEHKRFADLVAKRLNVNVEYYCEDTDSYKTGTFKLKGGKWKNRSSYGKALQYDVTSFELEEN